VVKQLIRNMVALSVTAFPGSRRSEKPLLQPAEP
jgi:hypothetical protein